jgi:hypothetical protein|eukprot:SAG31_NODE_8342_length_1470_cov_1.010212_2_plen_132_part_00
MQPDLAILARHCSLCSAKYYIATLSIAHMTCPFSVAVRVIEAAGRFKRLSRLAKDRNKEDAALRELETRESLNNPDSNGENFGDHKYRQIQQDMVQMEKRIVDGIKVRGSTLHKMYWVPYAISVRIANGWY